MANKPYKRMAKKTYKKRGAKRTRGVGIAVKQYVKRALSKDLENKLWIDYGINQSIATATQTTPTNAILVPRIAQGVQKSQRIGCEIKVKKAALTVFVNLLPYNATTNPLVAPVYVKMWIVQSRQINTIQLTNTTISTTFFDVVNSFSGFSGNMLDLLFNVNSESWKVIATKQIELGLTTNTNGPADNSRFTKKFSFQLAKHLGTVKFDDAGTTPTNKNMFLVFQAVYPDGSSTAIQAAEYHWHYKVEYEDA